MYGYTNLSYGMGLRFFCCVCFLVVEVVRAEVTQKFFEPPSPPTMEYYLALTTSVPLVLPYLLSVDFTMLLVSPLKSPAEPDNYRENWRLLEREARDALISGQRGSSLQAVIAAVHAESSLRGYGTDEEILAALASGELRLQILERKAP